MLKDARGVALSGSNRDALGLWEQALNRVLTYSGDPVGLCDQALEADPGLTMARALKAHLFAFSLHPALQPKALAEVVAARDQGATEREQAHLEAAAAWARGDLTRAQALLDGLLRDEPRDLAAMMFAHQADFFGATTGKLLERPNRALDGWPADLPGRGYLVGMRAFGLEEAGEYAAAEEAGREALAINPDDVWAVHAVAHVMEMQGRDEDGVAWYREHEACWRGGFFAVHNWWHLALYHVDQDDPAAALAVHDQGLAADRRSITLNLCDAASLLWRLWLAGHDTDARFDALAELFAKPAARPCHVFNDVHAAIAFAGAERHDLTDEHLRRLEALAEGGSDHARMVAGFGLPAARAVVALARGDASAAAETLSEVMNELPRMTGSIAQRDVMVMTLIEAHLRAGEHGAARAWLKPRLEAKPNSARIARDLARAG